tara:strand:+ start:1285 stop:1539 length:255 start_codon:yes stop_codon:yes gene_type:complete
MDRREFNERLAGCVETLTKSMTKEFEASQKTEPKTKDVWVVWFGEEREFDVVENKGLLTDKYGNIYSNYTAIKKVTLTEGEFDV